MRGIKSAASLFNRPIMDASHIINAAPRGAQGEVRKGGTMLRAGILMLILSASVFSRMAINTGFYAANFSLIMLYVLPLILWASRAVRVDIGGLMLYGASAIVSVFSLILNPGLASPTSALLLLALYLPFVFHISPRIDTRALWDWAIRAFGNVAVFCALCGILQFFAQFAIKATWLFDYAAYLPNVLRMDGLWNTIIPAGGFIKSNGFFFAEPSGFSQFMAAGLICELNSRKSLWRMALMGVGLLLSYSGTGILIFLIAFMFPLNFKTFVRIIGLAAVAGLLFFLLADSLNLWFTLDRAAEFSSENSSGYMRFVAPFRLLHDRLFVESWTPLIGNGPGAILRTVMSYDFHDPTWAKVVFEYGIIGAAAILGLVIRSVRRAPIPSPIRAVFFFSWFVGGGGLLSPNAVALMFGLLAVWPALPRAKPSLHSLIRGQHDHVA